MRKKMNNWGRWARCLTLKLDESKPTARRSFWLSNFRSKQPGAAVSDAAAMPFQDQPNYPRPDYLSSSRKRLAPQLIFKAGILNAWQKKTAVALNKGFFATLPKLREVEKSQADIAWFVYDIMAPDAGAKLRQAGRCRREVKSQTRASAQRVACCFFNSTGKILTP